MELPGACLVCLFSPSILFSIFIRKKMSHQRRSGKINAWLSLHSALSEHHRLYFEQSRDIPIEHHATFFHITNELLHGRLLPSAERLIVVERSPIVVVRVPQGRIDREPHGIVRERHPPRPCRVNTELHIHAFHLLD